MYNADIQPHAHPKLSQMIDLAGIGLTESTHAQLDSIYEYEHHKKIIPSEMAAWFGVELSVGYPSRTRLIWRGVYYGPQ